MSSNTASHAVRANTICFCGSFCESLVNIRNRHSDVVQTMAQGVIELKDSTRVDCSTENNIQYFLDRFYMNRISIRMLINQHTLLFGSGAGVGSDPRHVGCIDPHCDVVQVIQDAAASARFLCERYYLACPELVVTQFNGERRRHRKRRAGQGGTSELEAEGAADSQLCD